MDKEIQRRKDAFKLALEIFNEVKGHRYNLPIENYLETGKKCEFDHIYTKILIDTLCENNIIRHSGTRSVRFTVDGYKLMQDILEDPENPPCYFPSVADVVWDNDGR